MDNFSVYQKTVSPSALTSEDSKFPDVAPLVVMVDESCRSENGILKIKESADHNRRMEKFIIVFSCEDHNKFFEEPNKNLNELEEKIKNGYFCLVDNFNLKLNLAELKEAVAIRPVKHKPCYADEYKRLKRRKW